MLSEDGSILLNWFKLNEMKSNDDKCHLIVANIDNISVSLGNEIIETSNSVKLLGNQKLPALARISKFLYLEKRKLIMRTFIESQFNYCPLVWMFHNRTLNNKINKLHERALRIVFRNNELSFQELLDKDNSITVHQRNLRKLAIEMYKVKHNLSPLPMQELLTLNI